MLKDGTPQGIREERRRGGKQEGGEHSLLCCLLFSSLLSSGNKLLLKSAGQGTNAAREGEAGGKVGAGGLIGDNKQYILPRLHPPPRSPHSSVFHSALSGPDGSDRLPSKLHFLADPAADHLFPFVLHHLASFVYDTLRILSLRGFWHRREYRAESQFQRGKK